MPTSNTRRSVRVAAAVLALSVAGAALGPRAVWAAFINPGSITPHVWSPDSGPQYENGNPDGYVEADTAAMAVHIKNEAGNTYDIDLCLELEKPQSGVNYYGFSAFDADGWDASYLPGYLPAANGSDCGANCDIDYGDGSWDLDASGIWGRYVTINSVSPQTRGGGTCISNYVGVSVNFTVDAGQSAAWITYGGLLAVPGASLPTGSPDSFVPIGRGASAVGGTFQSRLSTSGADKTINFQGVGAIGTAPADLSVTTLCADFTEPEPYVYASTVTNGGPNIASSVILTDTLPLGVTYDAVTTATLNPNATCTLLSSDPDIVECAYTGDGGFGAGNLGDGQTWIVKVVVDLDPGTQGSLSHLVKVSANEEDDDASDNEDSCASTVAVTLNRFEARRVGDRLRFDWTTATEVGNIAFEVEALVDGAWSPLGDGPIPAKGIDSIVPHDYALEVPFVQADGFRLVDYDRLGRTTAHGPFALGEAEGVLHLADRVDWQEVRLGGISSNASTAASEYAPAKRDVVRLGAPRGGKLGANATAAATDVALDLIVSRDGLYRATFDQLRSAGLELAYVPTSSVAVTRAGVPVPVRVQAAGAYNGGGFLEFWGEARDSLYSDDSVYRVSVDPGLARRIPVDPTGPSNLPPAPQYVETKMVERQRAYTFGPPGDDPWYDTAMLVFTSSRSWDFPFDADGLVAGAGPAVLHLSIWGVTDWPDSPDHRVRIEVNDRYLATETFDGHVARDLDLTVPDGVLRESGNVLRLTLPGDTGVAFDLVNLDSYGISYPRKLVAQEGRLSFEAAGRILSVRGLPSPNVVVYREADGALARLSSVRVAFDGRTYAATFAGSAKAARYHVSAVERLAVPETRPVRPAVDLLSEPARLLVISHPRFLAGVQPLLDTRRSEGWTVRAVDVFDVYATYGDGVAEPETIRAYVRDAVKQMGTEAVLLVGGDTYDYKDYLGLGSVSFLPTPYAPVDSLITFAPLDALYADVDDDGIPDAAIGRLPARTEVEMDRVVAKTLSYADKTYGETAVFAADGHDGRVSFSADSEVLVDRLGDEWEAQRAYIDTLGAAGARAELLAAIRAGTAVTSYAGHSTPRGWARDTLLRASDVPALGNEGRPTVVVQWGCWNAYHVSAESETLAGALLLKGEQGAAAVLGAAALSDARAEAELGRHIMPLLSEPGMPIGMAVQQAKHALAETQPDARDVLLGWSLLGDPSMPVRR